MFYSIDVVGSDGARWREFCLLAADLVDLTLEVVDHLGGHLVAEDLEEVDALVAGDRLVRRQLDALLDLSQKNNNK